MLVVASPNRVSLEPRFPEWRLPSVAPPVAPAPPSKAGTPLPCPSVPPHRPTVPRDAGATRSPRRRPPTRGTVLSALCMRPPRGLPYSGYPPWDARSFLASPTQVVTTSPPWIPVRRRGTVSYVAFFSPGCACARLSAPNRFAHASMMAGPETEVTRPRVVPDATSTVGT